VLDGHELALLKLYVNDPSPSTTQTLLKKQGLLNEEAETGGQKKLSSLVAFAMEREAFSQEEIVMLKDWFDTPEMTKELEGVEPTRGDMIPA
jgi:hypothetical protein